jgi:hypothetical protein
MRMTHRQRCIPPDRNCASLSRSGSQADEGAHDRDVDLHGALAAQDVGNLLSRRMSFSSPTLRAGTVMDATPWRARVESDNHKHGLELSVDERYATPINLNPTAETEARRSRQGRRG